MNPKPFDCSYTPQFAELLNKLGISLAISTYQAGKVVFLSAIDNDRLIQLPRTFVNAMGMAESKDKLAISAGNEVVVLRNRQELAATYPQNKNIYDGIYIPSVRYNTGYLALHDMEFLNDKLVAVNTLFSCLSYIDDTFSFTPFWQPPFISELFPEDRCHLNGMATKDNEIKYVTALGNTNSRQAWRDTKMSGGILMEFPSGKVILSGLAMPHSPRIYNGKLYVLNSAKGELLCVDPNTGSYEVVVQLGGFARGMSMHGDYLFIGLSKLRHNSKTFSDLEISKTSFAGVVAVYLPYKSIVGHFKYEMSVDEIYDVKVIADSKRPSLLSVDMPIHNQAIITPHGSFWSTSNAEIKQQPEDKPLTKTESTKYTLKLHKKISIDNLLKDFHNLIAPDLIPELRSIKTTTFLTVLTAIFDNKAIAMTVLSISEEKKTLVQSIFVLPEFRRQRIAKEMLKQIEKILTLNKIDDAKAICNKSNENAEILNVLFKSSDLIELILK